MEYMSSDYGDQGRGVWLCHTVEPWMRSLHTEGAQLVLSLGMFNAACRAEAARESSSGSKALGLSTRSPCVEGDPWSSWPVCPLRAAHRVPACP